MPGSVLAPAFFYSPKSACCKSSYLKGHLCSWKYPVISNIVNPLTHEIRFAMLKALSTGSMTFKELGTLTDSKGGHLLYHLNKLIDSGLVIKTDAGRYSLTDKGMGVMELIKKLYSQQRSGRVLEPSAP
jgi:predicted transcriptional regulator